MGAFSPILLEGSETWKVKGYPVSSFGWTRTVCALCNVRGLTLKGFTIEVPWSTWVTCF